jgi:hypothetical protein
MSRELPASVTGSTAATEPKAQQLMMELPAVQQVALQELGKGATITDAALAAGVDAKLSRAGSTRTPTSPPPTTPGARSCWTLAWAALWR